MPAAIMSWSILALGALCGCAAIHVRTEVARAVSRRLDAVVVAPMALAFPHRRHEAYEKTQNVMAALRAGQIMMIGPEELPARSLSCLEQSQAHCRPGTQD